MASAALTTPAEPAPAQAAKPSGPSSRPLAGPVVPLGTPLKEPDDLLGGAPTPPGKEPPAPGLDAVANRLLVKGEPTRTEAGRADDFAWPPRLPNLVTKEPLPPTGAPLTVVRAPPPAAVPQAALPPAAKLRIAGRPRARVAGQPVLQGQIRQQAQAPNFWRRHNSGPPTSSDCSDAKLIL